MKKMKYGLLSIAIGLASCALMMAQPPAGGGGGRGGGKGGGGGRGGGGAVFSVTSPDWEDGAVLPMKNSYYGKQGGGPSPAFEFHWTQGGMPAMPPAALMSYAVVFHDAENSTNKTPEDTLHWSAFNIPGTAKGLPEGLAAGAELPDGTRNGPGIANRPGGTPGYFGPGAGAGPYHHYIFEFYALDAKLDITSTATRAELMKAMDGHVIGKAVYYARFANNPGAK